MENHSKKKGNLFIISAPSGTGKTTICSAVLKKLDGINFSISHTTRPPREGEVDGKDYFFISVDEFRKKIEASDWLEWAEVHGNHYGTSKAFITESLSMGQDVLLDIDVQGAVQVKELYPESIMIFIMPPSMEILKERLSGRGTDSRGVIERRLENARKEIGKKDLYRHLIVNDRLEDAICDLMAVFKKYR